MGSAAMAKLGAMFGTLLFPLIDRYLGVIAVMLMQATLCLLGAVISHVFLEGQSYGDKHLLGQDSDCSGLSGVTVGKASDDDSLELTANREDNDFLDDLEME